MELTFLQEKELERERKSWDGETENYSINTVKSKSYDTLEGDKCYVKNQPVQGGSEVPGSGYITEQNGQSMTC